MSRGCRRNCCRPPSRPSRRSTAPRSRSSSGSRSRFRRCRSPRIPLAEARSIVADRGYEIPRTDGDLDPEGERQISAYVKERFGHDFVFITDYHPEIRPFYHMRDPETGLTKSYDLL